MKILVINIGDELLNGQTLNSNLSFIGDFFFQRGLKISQALISPDKKKKLVFYLRQSVKYFDFILLSGGLGPTSDDITVESIVDAFSFLTYHNFELEKNIKARQNTEKPPSYYQKQCCMIKGAEIIPNKVGYALGFSFVVGSARIITLPGPPRELEPMLAYSFERFKEIFIKEYTSAVYYIYFLSEYKVEEMTQLYKKDYPNLVFAYCSNLLWVRLSISVPIKFKDELDNLIPNLEKDFNPYVFKDKEGMYNNVVHYLKKNKLSLSLAESCTGGAIAKKLTSTAGSSEYLLGSLVTYSNESKEYFLGVSLKNLKKYGAVSENTALEMLEGLKNNFNSDCGLSVTGFLDSNDNQLGPTGLVFIGVFWKDKKQVEKYNFVGDRLEIRKKIVYYSLFQLYSFLLDNR